MSPDDRDYFTDIFPIVRTVSALQTGVIMKNGRNTLCLTLICIAFLYIAVSPVSAAIFVSNGTEIPPDVVSSFLLADPSPVFGFVPAGEIIFFTNSQCSACQMAEDFLDTFSEKHPDLSLVRYDLFDSQENMTIFEEYKDRYHRKYLSTPSILAGNLTIEGTQDMKKYLEDIMLIQSGN